MKRFKKLTIYILVGVLASSSVLMSYKKAETVQASATLTLGTGALLVLGILGAYGIVYKGATDSVTGNYIWESALPKYNDELENVERKLELIWDSSVEILAPNFGYDPNDDWNGDEDKPPKWDKLVKYFNENNSKLLKLGATVFGMLASIVTSALYNEIKSGNMKGFVLNSGDELIIGADHSFVDGKPTRFFKELIKSNIDELYVVFGEKSEGTVGAYLISTSPLSFYRDFTSITDSYGISTWQNMVGTKYDTNYEDGMNLTSSNTGYKKTVDGTLYYYAGTGMVISTDFANEQNIWISFGPDDSIASIIRSVYRKYLFP